MNTERKTEIVAETDWIKEEGSYPFRYVVLQWNPHKSCHPFSRHMQVDDGRTPDYFVYGHYYMDYIDAFNDMRKSYFEVVA